MAVVSRQIAECYLKGESFIYVFYDDVTLDILRFEIKGSVRSRLSLMVAEDDLEEEVNATGKLEQGNDIQIVETTKQWKMVQVVENLKKLVKLPAHIRIRAEWKVV